MTMKIGATTFVFRYLLRDPQRAPRLQAVVEQAHELGLKRLQICENARPLEVAASEWESVLEKARELGVEIQMGCKTLDPAILERYLARAAAIPSRTLRVVLEEHEAPSRAQVDAFLEAAVRLVEKYRMRLAIENHFHLSVRELAAAVKPFPADLIGFCLDAANSLRRFETVEDVFECLGSRPYCYHLKDYTVQGSDVGFAVGGAPLGKGCLNLDWVLEQIGKSATEPEIYLENWVPGSGVWERDVQADREWLAESIETLRLRVQARAAQAG